ncbi:hypothetical protein [Paraburkholderia kururiensis]|uniref:Uncharacterized protein n=1 Tax=Paraburkholderia kururiensis TaxID=984307 RepID=A0ABZ0WQK7_9BURK|nr:hypothetical protein [Paraburkholderia kururiensis]WQD79694.1 hypothetical protein U0042_08440 [Paraburkholderia kururiensis]
MKRAVHAMCPCTRAATPQEACDEPDTITARARRDFSGNVPCTWRITSGACRLFLRRVGLEANVAGALESGRHAFDEDTCEVRPVCREMLKASAIPYAKFSAV